MGPPRVERTFGTVGRRVVAKTNAFELSWSAPQGSTGCVYHYDAILPQWDTKDREFKLGKVKGTELMMRLQEVVRPDVFSPLGAYDGKKNLFSFQRYSFQSEQFVVPWETGRQGRAKNVSVKVVFVKEINVKSLRNLVGGDPASINPEGDAATALNMLNLFLQSTPRMTDPKIYNVKSFFTPDNKRASDRIRPLELWRGFFQSVRPAIGRIIVNVDVTVGVVIPPGNLEQICGDFLRIRNLRDLSNLSKADAGKLRLFLKGVKVEVKLPGHAGKRAKSIRDIAQDVGSVVFQKDGDNVTVAEHFKRTHNVVIHPRSLGVRVGQDGLFPMSVCKTVQQLFKNRSSPDVVREALDFSPPNPNKRLEAITAGWQQLRYSQSPFLLGAGINVNPKAMEVKGRILPPPEIGFAKEKITLQRQGQWDVMRKILLSPADLKSWVVVDFAGCDPSILNMFISDLAQAMGERGMRVGPVSKLVRMDGNARINEALDILGQETRPHMILAILPESAAQLYREVKRYGDITRGVATQCVKWSGKLANDAKNRRANQYHNNLILKINVKLGGTNCVPADTNMEFLRNVPTMILGADVSHPGPGSLLPSISALVASMDPMLLKYAASIRVQATRTEMIDDLTEMFGIALQTFKAKNNLLPHRIFMFRDGVSEGEFATVREREISAMRVTITKEYGLDATKWPAIIFIVVGKRHHFRFFPMEDSTRDQRGNGNMHAGFVVDQDIAHPVYPDFYLQSQPGLKGTSRPSHYTVLANSPGYSPDRLQQIAYSLCHCYSRSTRSVKIPAPVYYADLVCRRAKFHFDDNVKDLDNISVNSDDRPHLDYYKQHFTAINNGLKDKMYFV